MECRQHSWSSGKGARALNIKTTLLGALQMQQLRKNRKTSHSVQTPRVVDDEMRPGGWCWQYRNAERSCAPGKRRRRC
jgi:hypothetical protein